MHKHCRYGYNVVCYDDKFRYIEEEILFATSWKK